MKKVLSFFILLLLVSSCQQDGFEIDKSITQQVRLNRNEVLKESFALSLAKSIPESPMLRNILKQKALETFDADYDVLYFDIKGLEVENGLTVEGLITKNIVNKSDLTELKNNIPTLTILIPELPLETFSANIWDTENVIPQVGVASRLTNDVKIFDASGQLTTLPAKYIPGFPVMVVKENERVIASTTSGNSIKSRRFKNIDGVEFQFLGEGFNGALVKASKNSARTTSSLDPKVIEAYNIYNINDGWQRDYIYYGITPTQPNGAFSYAFKEKIISFSLAGSLMGTYTKITGQTGDPKLKGTVKTSSSFPSQASGWTSGFFEFKIRVLYNGINGTGSEGIQTFSVAPTDLMGITYTRTQFAMFYVFEPTVTSFKTFMLNPQPEIINWDISAYATSIKIEVEEVDVLTTTGITESRSLEYATNFGTIDDVFKKIGLKFGASTKGTTSGVVTKTYTEGNDPLGFIIYNFADDIIISSTNLSGVTQYTTRLYSSGEFTIGIEPIRVQPD